MLNHILVILSNGKSAGQLLTHAAGFARAAGARVTILQLLDASSKRVDPLDWHIRKMEVETQLSQLAEQLRQTGIETQVAISEHTEAAQLVEYARANEASLMLVPKHSDNMSNLIHDLMKRTNIPILIVPTGGFVLHDAAEARSYQNILIPLDGSQRAECILPLAAYVAQACDARLVVAHVVRKPEMPRRAPLTREETELAERIVDSNRADANRYLEQVVSRLPEKTEMRLLVSDNITSALHRLAHDEQIDLIILSAHGYTGEPQWPYGSITNTLVAYSARPVLVVQDLPVGGDQGQAEAQVVAHRSGMR